MSATLLKKTPAISVVIVNFNGGQLVLDCLAKLREQTLRPLEIILVDNASQDGSGQRAETEFPEVKVIHAGANLGFAKGNTHGHVQHKKHEQQAGDCHGGEAKPFFHAPGP